MRYWHKFKRKWIVFWNTGRMTNLVRDFSRKVRYIQILREKYKRKQIYDLSQMD